MPRFYEPEELGLTQEQFDAPFNGQVEATQSKSNQLQQRKQEKLGVLGTRKGAADNQIMNELSDAEYQYLVGRSAAELAQPQDAYGEGSGNRWLYSYGTKEGEGVKLGTAGGFVPDPDLRYQPEEAREQGFDYGWESGPQGVDTERTDNRMKLLFPERVANTLEHMGHGREAALDGRTLVKPENPDQEFYQKKEQIGDGYTEYYDSKEGLYGDSRDDQEFDKESLWQDFLVTTGQADAPEQSEPTEETSREPFEKLKNTMLQRESSGNYQAINDEGYVGGYQFGAQALEDLGYLKKGASKRGNKILAAEQAWTGKNGVSSLQDFLSNKEAQDKAFEENIDVNYQRLVDQGVLNEDSPIEEVSGRVAAAHLLGAQGSANLEDTDAYGTSGQEYYELGKNAVLGEPVQKADDDVEPMGVMEQLVRQEAADRDTLEKVWYETSQLARAIPAQIIKGATNLADAVQEFATWGPQTVVRKLTGDEEYDIDLINDEFKERFLSGVDDAFGYERVADDITFQKMTKILDDAGVEITDYQSIEDFITGDTEGAKELAELAVSNPSLTIGAVAELIGSGGAFKLGVTMISKGLIKAAPKFGKAVEKMTTLNRSKKAASELTTADKISDLVKGSSFVNADLATRMNEDITQFEANNEGEEPSPEKLLSMLITNKIAATAEVGALKLEGKLIGSSLQGFRKGVLSGVAAAGYHAAKSGLVEGGQETLDGIIQNVNQKFESKAYEGMTKEEIINDASAEILAGTAVGTGAGVQIGTASEGVEALKNTGNIKELAGKGKEKVDAWRDKQGESEAQTNEEDAQQEAKEMAMGDVVKASKGEIEDVESLVDSLETVTAPEIREGVNEKESKFLDATISKATTNLKDYLNKNPEFKVEDYGEAEKVINTLSANSNIDDATKTTINNFAKQNNITEEKVNEIIKKQESIKEKARKREEYERVNVDSVVKASKGEIKDVESLIEGIDLVSEPNNRTKFSDSIDSNIVDQATGNLKKYLDENPEHKVKSSNEAERVLNLVLGSAPVNEATKSTLNKFAKSNKVSQERFDEIVKSYESVEEEATTGKRGVFTREARIKSMLESGDPNPTKLNKEYNELVKWKNKNDQSIRELKSGIEEAELQADKMTRGGISPQTRKVERINTGYTKADGNQYQIDVAYNSNSGKWEAKIDDAIKRLESKQEYKKTIDKVVNETTSKAGEMLSDPVALGNYVVPTNDVKKEIETSRKAERTRLQRTASNIRKDLGKAGEVSKVIVDEDDHSKKWDEGSDYRKLNSNLVNPEEFNSNDTVMVNATGTAKKSSKTNEKTSSLYRPKNEAGQLLKKATDAGATVVLDPEMSSKDNRVAKKGIEAWLKKQGYEEVAGRGYYVRREEGTEALLDAAQKAKKAQESKSKAEGQNIRVGAENLAKYRANDDKDAQKVFQEKAQLVADSRGIELDAAKKLIKDKLAKEVKDTVDQIEYVRKAEGDLSELDDVNENVMRLAEKEISQKDAEDKSVGQVLSEWKKLTEEERLSGQELTTAVKNLVDGIAQPMQVVKDLFKDKALAVNEEPVWEQVYQVQERRGKSWVTTGSKELLYKDGEPSKEEIKSFTSKEAQFRKNGTVREVPVALRKVQRDVTSFLKVSRPTVLNTLGFDQLPSDVRERGKAFANLVKKAITPKGDTVKDKFNLYNSPARGIVYDKDGNVVSEVATAMDLALGDMLDTDLFKLLEGNKNDLDISRMFRVDSRDVTDEMREFAKESGMLRKTMADSLGKKVLTQLGVSLDKDSVIGATEYEALVADLGNIAILAGEKAGYLENKELESDTFASLMDSGTVRGTEATVSFVSVPTEHKKVKGSKYSKRVPKGKVDSYMKNYETATEGFPEKKTGIVWPETRKLSNKAIEQQLNSVRNDVTGAEVPNEAKDTLKNMMNTPYVFDTKRVDEFLELVDQREAEIKSLLGYVEIGSNKYEKLTFDNKEIQESINRDVDDSIRVLREFRDIVSEGQTELYFRHYYTGNGRFMMDSNTINPQTNKLHRFLVQPKALEVTHETDGLTFSMNGKDTSFYVRDALAQSMGMGIDKADTDEKIEFVNALLSMDKATRDTLKDELIAKGEAKFVVGDKTFEAEAEHLTHTLQGFDFLDQVASGKVTSSLTSEYDSLTSGYNNKLQQFPVLANMDGELAKVGIMTEGYLQNMTNVDTTFNPAEGKAVNDVFARGKEVGFYDSYQSLAKQVVEKLRVIPEKLPWNEKAVFEGVSDMLPGGNLLEGGPIDIDGAMRNLFKNPFMIFNYSAKISTIRKSLSDKLAVGVLEGIAGSDLTDKESKEYKTAQFIVSKLKPKGINNVQGLREKLREESMDKLVNQKGKKIVDGIANVMDKTYGQAVEDTFKEKFANFVAIQDTTNDAFKVMFRLFDAQRVEKLKERSKDGLVTKKDHVDVLTELWDTFPYIVGPLTGAKSKKDVITVLSVGTNSPRSSDVSRRAPQTGLPESTRNNRWWASKKINPLVKQMQEASQAGSVLPFHFIDGAELGGAINAFTEYMENNLGSAGVIPIHDAVMARIDMSDQMVWEYNKKVFETNKNYSIMDSLKDMITRGKTTLNQMDKKNLEGLSSRNLDSLPEKQEFTFEEAFQQVESKVVEWADKVSVGRQKLYADTLEGAHVGNMIGSPGSLYRLGDTKPDSSYLEKYKSKYKKVGNVEVVKTEREEPKSAIMEPKSQSTNSTDPRSQDAESMQKEVQKAQKETKPMCLDY